MLLRVEKEVFDFEHEGIKYYYHAYRKASKIGLDSKGRFVGAYPCTRCGGIGSGPWYQDNGICYECRGSKERWLLLNTTKNIETAKRRVIAEQEKKAKEDREFITHNLEKMLTTYTEKFYLILDTEEVSTYTEREYLKSKGSKWNSFFRCWWNTSKEGLDKFHLIEVNTRDVLNDCNWLESDKVFNIAYPYLRELEDKKRKVIE